MAPGSPAPIVRSFLLLALFQLSLASGEVTPVWRAQEGSAVIEAEDVAQVMDGSSWVIGSQLPGHRGHGYLQTPVDRQETPPPLVYHIHLAPPQDTPSSYLLAVRVHLPDSPAQSYPRTVRLQAAFHLGQQVELTAEQTAAPSDPADSWILLRSASPLTLDPGIHEITLRAPPPGLALDQLQIYPSTAPPPPPETDPAPLLFPLEFDDTTPPPAPHNLRLRGQGCAHLHLQWASAEDEGSGILGYDIFWRRQWVGRSYRPHYIMSGLQPFALYQVNVSAVDLAGNRSRETGLLVETDAFHPDAGSSVKSVPAPFLIDGLAEPAWERQQRHPLLDHRERERASFRLGWDAQNLYLLVTALPDAFDTLTLHLDPEFNQAARPGDSHRRLTFPQEESDRPAPAAHAVLKEDGILQHELALRWADLEIKPPDLLGLNIVLTPNKEDAAPVAWRFHADGGVAEDPYTFPVVQLTDGLPSGSSAEWMPPDIWRERDGYAVVEAEAIEHDPAWEVRQDSPGHTGDGFLGWRQPIADTRTHPGDAAPDYTTEHQGTQRHWLIVRIFTDKPGAYHCDVRFRKSPDAQAAWLWRLGGQVTNSRPIRTITLEPSPTAETPNADPSSASSFAWSTSGSQLFYLKRGLNDLYLSAASPTCQIDRVALYREGQPEIQAKALDPATAPSQRFR